MRERNEATWKWNGKFQVNCFQTSVKITCGDTLNILRIESELTCSRYCIENSINKYIEDSIKTFQ